MTDQQSTTTTSTANPLKARPIWIDLFTSDAAGATEFYRELFGWNVADQGEDFGHYAMIDKGGKFVGGLMGQQPGQPGGPTTWTVYLEVGDIADATDRARAAGAQVMVEPMEVQGTGWMAVLVDPSGAGVGLWQPTEFGGFDLPLTPGTPVWFELMSSDFDAALPFYRDVLGWDISWMGPEGGEEGFRYVTNGKDEKAAAGLCDAKGMLGGAPSYWRIYFGVENCDQAAARVVELGGKVTDGPTDSPFGRFATCLDPQGATFQINQEPQRG